MHTRLGHWLVVGVCFLIGACGDDAAGDGDDDSDPGPTDSGATVDSGGNTIDSGGGGGTDAAASGTMSFFVTSSGNATGDFDGLSGADEVCQSLAEAAGAGDRTWRAYLSTSVIDGVDGAMVNARDRIGTGPWYNFDGDLVAADVDALHENGIATSRMLTETGQTVPSAEHDILTGSKEDGTAWATGEAFPDNPTAPAPTCLNWTSSSDGDYVFVGHTDWQGPEAGEGDNWNSRHLTTCDTAGLQSTAGNGRLYCFAAD